MPTMTARGMAIAITYEAAAATRTSTAMTAATSQRRSESTWGRGPNSLLKFYLRGGLALRTAPRGGWARAQTACGTEALDASSRFVTLRPVI